MPLKRWRYLAVFGPELMLCTGDARVAGIPQRWWAVALPDGRLFERTSARRLRPPFDLHFDFDEARPIEVVSEHGGRRIWTRKRAGVPVRGSVRVAGSEWQLEGPLGFLDESAGHHARHTTWRWSAGIGRARGGQAVAWNLVEGLHDSPRGSERAVWVDGEPHEVGPQRFAADLSRVGDLRFEEWCAREDHTNRLLVRSDYRQPFGSFSGALPGGLELESGYGVMEWHDAWW
jgi:hypothetical protein